MTPQQEPHICGLSRKHLQPDEQMRLIRLAPEDVQGETHNGKPADQGGLPIKPGQYHVGEEAFARFAPKVIERLKKTPAINDNGHRVFVDADGNPCQSYDDGAKPVMALPPDATVASVDRHALT
jgi:hypothetical protein